MNLFTGGGRVGRLHYLGINLATGLASAVALVALLGSASTFGGSAINLLLFSFVLMVTWIGYASAVRRLHDLGHIGWMLLLGIVPIINIGLGLYLLFGAGDPDANRWGRPPGSPPLTPEDHRRRVAAIAASSAEAYAARNDEAFLNADGSYNMDSFSVDR